MHTTWCLDAFCVFIYTFLCMNMGLYMQFCMQGGQRTICSVRLILPPYLRQDLSFTVHCCVVCYSWPEATEDLLLCLAMNYYDGIHVLLNPDLCGSQVFKLSSSYMHSNYLHTETSPKP